MKRLLDILIVLTFCVVIHSVAMMYKLSQMEKQEKGMIIDWRGFQDRFDIEYKQVRHRNGMAEYLDKHGRVVLVRPKTDKAINELTQLMDAQ